LPDEFNGLVSFDELFGGDPPALFVPPLPGGEKFDFLPGLISPGDLSSSGL
jgi:hypothetical protein